MYVGVGRGLPGQLGIAVCISSWAMRRAVIIYQWKNGILVGKGYVFTILPLTLKAPITTAADDFFSEKTSLNISCESSAWQRKQVLTFHVNRLLGRENKS